MDILHNEDILFHTLQLLLDSEPQLEDDAETQPQEEHDHTSFALDQQVPEDAETQFQVWNPFGKRCEQNFQLKQRSLETLVTFSFYNTFSEPEQLAHELTIN